jgi:hypothetical protein
MSVTYLFSIMPLKAYVAGDNQNSGILQPKRVIYSGVKKTIEWRLAY